MEQPQSNFSLKDNKFIPMKEHEYVLHDAFEAITNGMHNPEVLEQLQFIKAGSAYYPFKQFVLAIRAFYSKKYEEALNMLQDIPESNELYALVPTLTALCSSENYEPRCKQEAYLLQKIRSKNTVLLSAIDQIADGLEADYLEVIPDVLPLLLKDLPTDLSEMLVRHLFQIFDELDTDVSDLVEAMKVYVNPADLDRMLAQAYIEANPESSILHWLKHAIQLIQNEEQEYILAVLELTKELLYTIPEAYDSLPYDDWFKRQYLDLMEQLNKLFSLRFGYLPAEIHSTVKKEQPKSKDAAPAKSGAQLELFDF